MGYGNNRRLRDGDSNLSQDQLVSVEGRLRIGAPVVYEIIRQEGEEELERPVASLWWSGVVAGLSIGFSVVAAALLNAYLPKAAWVPLLDSLGYSVGFLIVIIGRKQLFTENTLTAFLPVLARGRWVNFFGMLRLWAVVLLANLTGTCLFGAGLATGLFLPPEVNPSILQMGHHLLHLSQGEIFLRAIVAGWLVATLVWLLPSAEQDRALVIILITYLIALGDFVHVIAGSLEVFYVFMVGETNLYGVLTSFIIPALFGNIIGGSALFALSAYAQVRKEI